MDKKLKASIFDIHPLSTHDGPGLRTAFFFKGCPLKCAWCQNPESINVRDEVWHNPLQCLGCGTCVEVCPEKAVSRDDDRGIRIDYGRCTGCGKCTLTCPGKALKKVGETHTIEEVLSIVRRDRPFMNKKVGGGITVTGGEPLLYPDFIRALFRKCRELSVHTALDTCGEVSWSAFRKVLPYTDMFLFDVKLIDHDLHKALTGKGNHIILGNLIHLSISLKEEKHHAGITIRTPLIPEATFTEHNLTEIGRFLDRELDGTVDKWELCAFNPLSQEKYDRLGLNWKYKGVPMLTRQESERALRWARRAFSHPEKVIVTGLTSGD